MGVFTVRQKQQTLVWVLYAVAALAVIGLAWKYWYITIPTIAVVAVLTAVVLRRWHGLCASQADVAARRVEAEKILHAARLDLARAIALESPVVAPVTLEWISRWRRHVSSSTF